MAVKLNMRPNALEDELDSYAELDEVMAYERIVARLEHEALERARQKAKAGSGGKGARRTYNR